MAGSSGCGKTTLSLALLREGWNYLSDDTILLRSCGEGVEAITFRRGFACSSHTLAWFPELHSGDARAAPWKENKVFVDVDQIYPGKRLTRCEPAVILFTEVAQTERSRLVPVDVTTALALLVQQSPGVLTQRTAVEQQMGVLGGLVAHTRNYRLLLGKDVYGDTAAVSRLIWQARKPDHGQDCY